ncbi:MAG: DNA repair protein RecO [Defluviitaleaceae bacterium]|nr:DNA repair protein RecO [Defluviitaleaceae bacterium]
MAIEKVRGIVINEYKSKESDKVLILFTKEMGKISAYAKGARKPKSKYAIAQLFTYADFVLFASKDFHSVTQIDIIENFNKIRNDYELICYSNYFLEIIDKTSFENSLEEDILLLLLKVLSALNSGKYKSDFIRAVFELKFASISGYEPEVINCTICGISLLESEKNHFSKEGCICTNCMKNPHETAIISYSTLYAIKYVISSDVKNILNFKLDDKVLEEFKKASEIVMKNIDIEIKSRAFL